MIRILWLALGAWGLSGGWPLQAAPSDPRNAAAWACMRAAIRPDGTMPPEAPCRCRARLGLSETSVCKRQRGQR